MKLPKSYYNKISYIGTVIAAANILLILFLSLVSLFKDGGNLYGGLYAYIILPTFLVGGLLLIPVGMLLNIRRSKRRNEDLTAKKIIINFNDKRQRNGFIIFLFGTVVFLFFTAIGSYEAFHYTESNEFCGKMCHTVMAPEYNAYQNSSHSKVACVECHIGSGVDWFVKAKISGMYQVYSVMTEKYATPIATPIHNLRPASGTCEQCHWPQKFYPNLLVSNKRYLANEENTEWSIDLRMKVGGSHSAQALTEGIHWHINEDVHIEYVAIDEKREFIPYVRSINLATNDTIIYENIEDPLTQEARDTLETRVMDCMDCHNRPAHHYDTPQEMIDHAIASGEIAQSLPNIKLLSMEILNATYSTTDSALMAIESKITEYYQEDYPEIFEKNKVLIDKAIASISRDFQNNFFPEMKASWDTYPVHIGHKVYNGCFRCHSGKHESKEGKTISNDCNLCHTILAQGSDSLEVAPFNGSLEFQHPEDIGEEWKEVTCSECHRNLY